MKTYQEMLGEIRDFKSWRGPDEFIHAPVHCTHVTYTNRVEWRTETVDCLCGAELDRDAFTADAHQPAPLLWEGLQAFYKHLGEKQEEAALAVDRRALEITLAKLEENDRDWSANTR